MAPVTRLVVLLSRVAAHFSARRLDDDFDEEIAAHVALLTEDNVRRGMPRDEARRAALLRFGGPMQLKEQHREERGLPFVDTTLQDIRYGARALRRNPAFALVAIGTLAIGIGAGTAVFTIARAVLLRPLPYAQPDRLVRVFETNPLKNWARNIAAPANYADWKRQNTVFTDLAAYEQFSSNGSGAGDVFLTGYGEPQGLKALGVTGNLFTVLGAPPLMGRVFTDEETYEGKGRVAIVSYGLWQSVFAGDPAIVGRTINVSGRAYDVVGVMPREFFFPGRDVQLWLPVAYPPSVFVRNRRPHYLGVVARLRSGVTVQRAQQEMSAIARTLERQYPDTNTEMGVRLESFHGSLAFEPRPALLMLSGAVALLFLIVCANVANLQLGRSAARGRELAIRTALGAGRRRLVRQLFTESLILSLAGGAAGVAIAWAARAAVVRFAAASLPLFADLRFDRSVVSFAIALSVAAPVLFGVVPALRLSRSQRLTERSEAGSREAQLVRSAFIGAEVALSVVLVVGAVLLVKSLLRLQTVDPGFDQRGVIAFTVTLPPARYPKPADRRVAFEEIDRRLAAQPGVHAAGAVSTLALRGFTSTGDSTIEGRAASDYERELRHKSVTPGYFNAMGIRLLAGRLLDERDTPEQPPVTVVNLALARKYFAGADAVGKRITFGRPQDRAPWITIVGIVADEQQDALDKAAQPQVYSPIRQQLQNPMTFVVRSSLDPAAAISLARREVQAVDRDLALTSVTTLEQVVSDAMGDHRFRTALLTAFAATALFLAALGIYGVLAYAVSQRLRELGIRLALGATPREVFTMVVRDGMRPVIAGGIVGLAGAMASGVVMRTLLFGVTPIDPGTYAVALAVLGAVALAACAMPARRATRVDPLVALREE
ncbi:MAG TPA: ABC transporter permease [Vicinamibacterales bacterium]|nr:ABC transporter permease [Vicinamibacterales bacterium]